MVVLLTPCNVFELADDDPNRYKSSKHFQKYTGKQITVPGHLITIKDVTSDNLIVRNNKRA
jgi:hypothetical protein